MRPMGMFSVVDQPELDVSLYESALELPGDALVDQRVPKKLLLKHGAVTSTDRRRIREGVEEIRWVAALKPTNIGVPEYRDEVREYLEVAVLRIHLRDGAEVDRLVELLHRAIPYPAFVLAEGTFGMEMSLAHKRTSQSAMGVSVLDGRLRRVRPVEADPPAVLSDLKGALPVARQPRTHLYALYEGWLDVLTAFEVARLSGRFEIADSVEGGRVRREALDEFRDLESQIVKLSRAAKKERQMARRVELNIEANKLKGVLEAVRSRL